MSNPTARSNLAAVRNPVLALPSAARLLGLAPDTLKVLEEVFRDLSKEARDKAHASWRKSKGPMAAYWLATSIYALHIARVLASRRRSEGNRGKGRTSPLQPTPG